MSEQRKAASKSSLDYESSNPSVTPLPEIFKTLDESDKVGLNTVWNCREMPLEGKLKFIEVHLKEQPTEIRAAYRKWRFEVDRRTKPYFMKSQAPRIQAFLEMLLAKNPTLDEFYSDVLELRKCLKKYGEFLEWANSEYLELPDEDEASFNIANSALETQMALQCKQYKVIQRYNDEVAEKLREQLNSITLNELSDRESTNPLVYFFDDVRKSICSFNCGTYQIKEVGKFSFTPAYLHNVTAAKDKIYAFEYSSKKLEVFDTTTNSNSPIETLSTYNIYKQGVIAYVNNNLWYIYRDGTGNNTIRYKINCAGAWLNGSFPNTFIEGAVAECDNKIYAVDFYGGSNAIYQYNEESKNWKQIGNVDYRRRFAAVASLNGGLYITGGLEVNNNNVTTKSCIVFKTNDAANMKPYKIADMNYPRSNHTLISANGKLFAIGGYPDKSNTSLVKSIEEYDPIRDEWSIVGSL